MTGLFVRLISSGVVALLLGSALVDAQSAGERASVTVAVDVAGAHFDVAGAGECHHTAAASIYEVPAVMWHAALTTSSRSLSTVNTTIWQPTRGGPPQVTLTVVAGSTTYEIATVTGGTIRGTATARVERRGAEGTLSIDGRTAAGQAVRVVIGCSGFTAPEDNG